MSEEGENTTIIVSKDTREIVKSLGKKGETYDEIIGRLVRSYKKGGEVR